MPVSAIASMPVWSLQNLFNILVPIVRNLSCALWKWLTFYTAVISSYWVLLRVTCSCYSVVLLNNVIAPRLYIFFCRSYMFRESSRERDGERERGFSLWCYFIIVLWCCKLWWPCISSPVQALVNFLSTYTTCSSFIAIKHPQNETVCIMPTRVDLSYSSLVAYPASLPFPVFFILM